MAKFIDIAVIHFQKNSEHESVSDDVIGQFKRAAERLDGTGVDFVVTCEGMESCGQTMEQAESYERPGPFMSLYSDFAKRNKCCVAGSIKLKADGNIYNALVFFERDGTPVGDYRKVFPTDREIDMGFSPGEHACVINTTAGRIGGIICFDLNFTELMLEYERQEFDILAFSSMFNGGLMQEEWAIRCRCFFASACKDGYSRIIDPLGRELAAANFYSLVGRARVNLDRFHFHSGAVRPKLYEIYKKYGKNVYVDTDSPLSFGILYSLTDSISAKDIAEEFELTPFQTFFDEARKKAGKRLPDYTITSEKECKPRTE